MPAEACVYVVDDDEAVRASLVALLESLGYRCQAFSSAGEFLAAAATLRPGCLITDIRMPGMDGLEMQQALIERALSFPLIVMTGHADVPLAVRSMKAGAVDFVEKPYAATTILESVENALARSIDSRAGNPPEDWAVARLAALSPREREVLQGLIEGLPNKTIAYDLSISPRTVEIHRARVMDKMGARSLSELIRVGLAAGVRPKSTAQH